MDSPELCPYKKFKKFIWQVWVKNEIAFPLISTELGCGMFSLENF